MKKVISFLSLFTSVGTLFCCAIPALFVVLGFGAAFAGIIGTVPQLIWISEEKIWIFGIGAALIIAGGVLQLRAKTLECPADPNLAAACAATRDWSNIIYFVSVAIYLVGAFFAFIAPRIS